MENNRNLPAEFKNDKNAMATLETISDFKGVLDIKGMKPYLVNLGGKPYINKGGLSLKLQEVANKRGGIKAILSIQVSYEHESPQIMEKFLSLSPQLLDKILKDRDYDMAAFTTPLGTSVNRCIIIFGDGLKVSETATANKTNVKMSTIHGFLDVMSATRAYNRCVKKITAEGFMDANLIDEENFDYKEDDFVIENSDIPFRGNGGRTQENQIMDKEQERIESEDTRGNEQFSEMETNKRDGRQVESNVSEFKEKELICSDCEAEINQAVSTFSINKFGKNLCRDCQKKYK